MSVKVVIADDQALVRGGFRLILDARDDIDVAGEAADGAEAVALVAEHEPDVVLMDIRMPGMDGLEATRRVLAEAPDTVRVLILTTFDLDEYVFAALRAGASGFLVKDTPPADLLAGVRLVAAGEALLSPGVTRQLVEAFVRRPADTGEADAGTLDGLTERERTVLTLVAKGLSNAEIGSQLYVSPATVKTHVAHILTKLGARDRAQLIVIAYESRLVRPGQP